MSTTTPFSSTCSASSATDMGAPNIAAASVDIMGLMWSRRMAHASLSLGGFLYPASED